jgi:hypothetical protein
MKQTAVDLVIEQLKEQIRKSTNNKLGTNRTGDYRIGLIKAIGLCKKANEMEKENVFLFAKEYDEYLFRGCGLPRLTAEQYYNEIFKSK